MSKHILLLNYILIALGITEFLPYTSSSRPFIKEVEEVYV